MAIELPDWFAKLNNLMAPFGGPPWTNANEDTAHAAGVIYQQHATNAQPAVTDAKTHGQRAASAVRGTAGTQMAHTVDHPQGAIKNLVDHLKGALVTALIGGGVVSLLLGVYKIYKLTDGGITLGQMLASALFPGGEAAWGAELAEGAAVQKTLQTVTKNTIANGAMTAAA
jgi:hypothetical protein